jgi:hypothetical protein
VLVDCLTLAMLYTLRVVAGAAAAGIVLSFWLLAFSVFLFLSLAFVKRYAELRLQILDDAGCRADDEDALFIVQGGLRFRKKPGRHTVCRGSIW